MLFDWLFNRHKKKPIGRPDLTEDDEPIEPDSKDETKTITIMNTQEKDNANSEIRSIAGRELVDEFLLRDFSQQGYNDAIINSDSSNAEANKEIIKKQLHLLINSAIRYYKYKTEVFDSLSKARKEDGMKQNADEIDVETNRYNAEISDLEKIFKESLENKGDGAIVIFSYMKGFQRGLAAITAFKVHGKAISNE